MSRAWSRDSAARYFALSDLTFSTDTSRKAGLLLSDKSLHSTGVLCGLAAGVWLGAAEAPTKLVNAGFSPFAISLCMVAGVFTARWTFPAMLKGTGYVFQDLRLKKHLIVWAIFAGALWAVANTLTVFAIRDVGLASAFPIWNTNSLVGLLWGRLLFRELQGAGGKNTIKVVGGAVLIVIAAIMLGYSSIHGNTSAHHAIRGLLAAAGASVMWGTMYVPYRKAYISGMNPLSFVTVFTIGELGTMFALTWCFDGGIHSSALRLVHNGGLVFWLFLGGFIWVVGDIFQQFATKYLGIGRGIPLSNTNQLWGLAWGALVFGELKSATNSQRLLVVLGSFLMVLGAVSISTALASSKETLSRNRALESECTRYGIDYEEALLAQSGIETNERSGGPRWWDFVILALALAIFVCLGRNAAVPPLPMSIPWVFVLSAVLLVSLLWGGIALWKRTRFT